MILMMCKYYSFPPVLRNGRGKESWYFDSSMGKRGIYEDWHTPFEVDKHKCLCAICEKIRDIMAICECALEVPSPGRCPTMKHVQLTRERAQMFGVASSPNSRKA